MWKSPLSFFAFVLHHGSLDFCISLVVCAWSGWEHKLLISPGWLYCALQASNTVIKMPHGSHPFVYIRISGRSSGPVLPSMYCCNCFVCRISRTVKIDDGAEKKFDYYFINFKSVSFVSRLVISRSVSMLHCSSPNTLVISLMSTTLLSLCSLRLLVLSTSDILH